MTLKLTFEPFPFEISNKEEIFYRYYIGSDFIDMKSTKHWCVTRLERVNNLIAWTSDTMLASGTMLITKTPTTSSFCHLRGLDLTTQWIRYRTKKSISCKTLTLWKRVFFMTKSMRLADLKIQLHYNVLPVSKGINYVTSSFW